MVIALALKGGGVRDLLSPVAVLVFKIGPVGLTSSTTKGSLGVELSWELWEVGGTGVELVEVGGNVVVVVLLNFFSSK